MIKISTNLNNKPTCQTYPNHPESMISATRRAISIALSRIFKLNTLIAALHDFNFRNSNQIVSSALIIAIVALIDLCH